MDHQADARERRIGGLDPGAVQPDPAGRLDRGFGVFVAEVGVLVLLAWLVLRRRDA
jgi:hypothetical protein